MAPFLRKVTTASGATAVQIVEKIDRKNRVIEHLGSAHTDAELAALLEVGRQKIHEGQPELDLDFADRTTIAPAIVGASYSRILTTTIRDAFTALGFDLSCTSLVTHTWITSFARTSLTSPRCLRCRSDRKPVD